jgi:hypothetical protein
MVESGYPMTSLMTADEENNRQDHQMCEPEDQLNPPDVEKKSKDDVESERKFDNMCDTQPYSDMEAFPHINQNKDENPSILGAGISF